MMEAILLDRDGVLNVDLPGSVCGLEDLAMIPGSTEAVALLTGKGYRVLVVTNQACVGRGDLSRETLEAIHARIDAEVARAGGRIDGWFSCTHRAEEGCTCRKPLPGLIRQAQAAFGFLPECTRFVGDAGRDVEAATAAGCIPVLVRTGKGTRTAEQHPDLEIHDDLLAFATHLPPARSA